MEVLLGGGEPCSCVAAVDVGNVAREGRWRRRQRVKHLRANRMSVDNKEVMRGDGKGGIGMVG